MEKVRPWCGQPSDRGRLKNRTDACTSCLLTVACKPARQHDSYVTPLSSSEPRNRSNTSTKKRRIAHPPSVGYIRNAEHSPRQQQQQQQQRQREPLSYTRERRPLPAAMCAACRAGPGSHRRTIDRRTNAFDPTHARTAVNKRDRAPQ